MTDSVNRILSALSAVRVPAAPGEYDLHALIAAALDEAGIAYAHEAKLADGARMALYDVPDCKKVLRLIMGR